MGKHFRQGRRPTWPFLGAGLAVAVAVGGGVFVAAHNGSQASASSALRRSASRPGSPPTTTPPAPLTVGPSVPAAGASSVDGTAPLVLTTSAAVSTSGRTPVISPSVAGTWSAQPGKLVFSPADAFAPDTIYTVTVPAGVTTIDGSVLARPIAYTWETASGSVLRLQQLLAELGYLPLDWTEQAGAAVPPVQAAYHPPAGQFSWTWSDPPASLAAEWVQGQSTAMTRGAIMAFESDHSLATDGVAGGQVWSALLAATSAATPAKNSHGYTYALAEKSSPETLTVWHDGQVVSDTGANTGIPQAPTADGTFPVYERLATQVMTGTNPDGSKYSDPVAWVAYFNGGDAVHYIGRSTYGYPQSLGCVEVSYATGARVWPYLTIGSLVTVAG